MSEVQKPAEEPVSAPVVAAPLESTPVENKPVEETPKTTEETPAVTEPAATEEAPVKEEVKPVEEGILGYKGPGLLKGLIFQKKHFWFGTEPVEHKSLASYLRGEKPEVANHNAAWASSTGKGLLFFSKKSTEKATPSHVFNLSEVSDITEEGTTDFFFNQGGHKYTFQASTLAERDNWVSTLKTKATEAKEIGETIKDNEEYKKTHTALSKPAPAVVTPPKKSTEIKDKVEAIKEEKKEEKAEKKEEKAEAKEEKKEEKSARKSRSASRKRTSIFGSIPGFGGKKEDKKEEKPLESTETPAAPAPVEGSAAPVPVVEPTPTPVEPIAPVTQEPASEPEATRPTPAKRNSIFDSFKNSFQKEKKPEEAPVVPAKDKEVVEPVSESAPVIPAVEQSEPLSTSTASPATVPTESTTITNGDAAKTEAPAVKSDKRKSSLPWLSSGKKEKSATSDEEGEKKPTSPFAKFRATVKGKSSPKTEKAPATEAEAPKVEDKKDEPVVDETKNEPAPVASTTTPQVAATA